MCLFLYLSLDRHQLYHQRLFLPQDEIPFSIKPIIAFITKFKIEMPQHFSKDNAYLSIR
jgi:hypothetical protein